MRKRSCTSSVDAPPTSRVLGCPVAEAGTGSSLVAVSACPLLPVPLDGPPVDGQTARERLDRREQPLLQAHDEQAGGRLGLAGGVGVPLLTGGAVFVEQAGQFQLRRV